MLGSEVVSPEASPSLPSSMENSQPAKRARVLRAEGSGDGAALLLSASQRVASAKDIVSGSLLPTLASENLEGFKAVLPTARPYPELITWASCCSGSEGVHYVVEAAMLALEDAGFLVNFKHLFSCESNKTKREWILHVLKTGLVFDPVCSDTLASDSSYGCVFTDICEMGQEEATCARHDAKCPVVPVDCLFVGTSCKDLSRANSSVDRTKLVLNQDTSKGAPAQTFRGMLEYCAGRRPVLLIYENVDAIDDKISAQTETNLSLLMQAMRDLSYEGKKVMTDAQEFGLPCRRRRLYILFVDVTSDKLDFTEEAIGRVFATFSDLITSCMRTHPLVQQTIFQPENSEHKELVAEILTQQQAIATKSAEKAKNSEQKQPQTWMDKHIAYADGLGVRWASPVAEKLASNPWFQALTMRERDALVLSRVAAPECEFRNLSQSLGRINSSVSSTSSGSLIAPTMLPGQILWIESQERLLTGFEALVLQGYPIVPLMQKAPLPPGLRSQSFLNDLAGNAMALPVALAMFQCALAAVPWATDRESCSSSDAEDEEVATALAAVAVLNSGGRPQADV